MRCFYTYNRRCSILDSCFVKHILTGWGSVSVGLRVARGLAALWLRVVDQWPAESDSVLRLKLPAVWRCGVHMDQSLVCLVGFNSGGTRLLVGHSFVIQRYPTALRNLSRRK